MLEELTIRLHSLHAITWVIIDIILGQASTEQAEDQNHSQECRVYHCQID